MMKILDQKFIFFLIIIFTVKELCAARSLDKSYNLRSRCVSIAVLRRKGDNIGIERHVNSQRETRHPCTNSAFNRRRYIGTLNERRRYGGRRGGGGLDEIRCSHVRRLISIVSQGYTVEIN